MFDRIEKVARFYPILLRVGLRSESNKTLRRKFDTMRIIKAKRSKERKAAIAPAEWQEFIEI